MAGVRVTGLKQTIRALERLGVSAADLKDAMGRVSHKVVADAKALTPVRTGRLQGAIRASRAKNKAVIRGGNNTTTKYASFVEYGSVHNEAVGMITNAVTNNDRYAVDALDREVKSLIARYGLN